MTGIGRTALAGAIWAAGWASAAWSEPWLISSEAIPSAQVELDLRSATYAQGAELTQAAMDELLPDILAAVGVDPAAAESEITPGGYLRQTNASLQTRIDADARTAGRAAAAIGYVFRQWSVLVSARDDAEGETAIVAVGFPDDALTPEAAQAFFEAAAAVNEGLGGGYTAFGDTMFFLNVMGPEHDPYSGLDDMEFAALLGVAVGRFDGIDLSIAAAGHAEAFFVGNDWEASPQGGDYAEAVGDADAVERLDALRERHTALVERFAAEFGWR